MNKYLKKVNDVFVNTNRHRLHTLYKRCLIDESCKYKSKKGNCDNNGLCVKLQDSRRKNCFRCLKLCWKDQMYQVVSTKRWYCEDCIKHHINIKNQSEDKPICPLCNSVMVNYGFYLKCSNKKCDCVYNE